MTRGGGMAPVMFPIERVEALKGAPLLEPGDYWWEVSDSSFCLARSADSMSRRKEWSQSLEPVKIVPGGRR